MHILTNNISPKYQNNWEEFIKNHPNNTVFQSPEMYQFYKKVDGFDPFLFYAEDNGKCVGILLAVIIKEGKGLKGYFSSRVVIYGGPLIVENESRFEILDSLLKTLVKQTKNSSVFIQFRNFFEWNNDEKSVFEKYGFTFRERLNLLLDTIGKEQLLKGMSATRRRQLKKALMSGVSIENPSGVDDVKSFYNILVDLYKHKVKKPLPRWSFFKNFYEFSLSSKVGIIKVVKYDGRVIGGILSPVTKEKNIYEWYVAGLDKDFKKNYPSILSNWAAMNYALDNNLKYFDFMGLGKPDVEYGVREFKMRFGGKVVNYGRFARRNNKLLYSIAEFGYNLLRKY